MAQPNNELLIQDINKLLAIADKLQETINQPGIGATQQQDAAKSLNGVMDMIYTLYSTLQTNNNYYQDTLQSVTASLNDQRTALSVIEDEFEQRRAKEQMLKQEKLNKIRAVEINQYYEDKYDTQLKLVKVVVYFLAAMAVLAFINKMLIEKGILHDNMMMYGLVGIASLFLSLYFWKEIYKLMFVNNLDYQTIDFPFNVQKATATAVPTTSDSSTDPWASTTTNQYCVGSSCCGTGLIFDASLNICAVAATAAVVS